MGRLVELGRTILGRPISASSRTPAAAIIGRRLEVGRNVVLPEVELLHLLFDQREVVLGQQMKVPLEGHIPVFWVPPLDVLQARGQQVGVDELFVLQDHAGLQLDMVGKTRTALIDPDRLIAFVE
ncbi:uncharacterized protein METZ01_LOCUS38169 [marine metagenome]|uniref:Uncharacterized protein n=1 Tax=marine metagenome TaxID=408172 RepID=A0A381R0T0_9ZZZZ